VQPSDEHLGVRVGDREHHAGPRTRPKVGLHLVQQLEGGFPERALAGAGIPVLGLLEQLFGLLELHQPLFVCHLSRL
jgi:hypothetical protein